MAINKMFFAFFVSIIFFKTACFSQGAVNSWQAHLPNLLGKKIIKTGDEIMVATSTGMYFYNLSDMTLDNYSKINGLSDAGISAIGYNTLKNTIVLAYANGNIDLLRGNVFFNVPDIKLKDILGSKTINQVFCFEDKAYLACDFGIVVINLEKQEIAETYYLSDGGTTIPVYSTTVKQGTLYAATSRGIFYSELNNSNLIDFNNWSRMTDIPNFNKRFSNLAVFSGLLFASYYNENNSNDTLYYFHESVWKVFLQGKGRIRNVKSDHNELLVVSQSQLDFYNSSFDHITNLWPGYINDAIIDEGGKLWMVHQNEGIIRMNEPSVFDTIVPSGPLDYSSFDIKIKGDKVYVVPGGRTNAYGNLYMQAKYFIHDNAGWNNFTRKQMPGLEGKVDFIKIAIDPLNSNHVFFGSWGNGLVEVNNNEYENWYNEDNTSNALQNIANLEPHSYIRIGGMDFDRDGNLWITNSGVLNPVVVRKTDGSWRNFSCRNLINNVEMGDILVTSYGYKWIVLPRNQGLFVMDDNGTIDNTTDDLYVRFGIKDQDGNSDYEIYCIAEDLDGSIWVGTSQGVLVYYNQDDVFDGNPIAHKLIMDVNGDVQYLLGTEIITSIKVDGANRKWMGTQNAGAFLISSDGSKQLMNFNIQNSPLTSNNILSIAINHNSGEVYFGTDLGLFSYRGSATSGNNSFSNVYVFPNPVRETYEGLVTIKGLMFNTQVKFTDINGNLVYETTSNGDQAIWNCKNFSNERVSTGVYLVFCTTPDGSQTTVEKLLIIH